MYWYSDGNKLFEVAEMIPDTEKEKERTNIIKSSGINSSDGVEKYLLQEAIDSGRNNACLRWSRFVKDEGFDLDDAIKKVFDFNDKLPDGLSKRELEGTVISSLKRSYNGND